ncbi:CDP-diacylglycerol--glycerol-3-phosphate 3-phosphatidyltransferase [Iodidimonas muriae]|uniref:CDP-diacylglycerol--glycerol-3-phosphate 3-phosphatidyltransferase n=1 Tax=Iodidimonas muriae TaxID=261467 RepID=A0ABQ2LGB5_9PROT|nr:CDP-diacylglycerol--glycerol-3-phosphate 3-phosphatidyltransferase [Iodidimonas muriae]GER07627.1 CDP-diacylglycerol--glycerol-3-phosphate 3-phosphatidyltransferase [Kordiimonadales bacterium JCM 17843]GGO13660.1 CDP-diacylglycerol--glycerol-3-phosphate 3-phosphatidyltransferase [Iodidimonas muriae]
MMSQIPNLLTLSRIVAIPVLVAAFYLDQPLGSWVAFIVFTLAGITDYFDGMLARKLNVVSPIGRFLDPIADKLMIGAAIVMLVAIQWVDGIHVIAAVIILLREILVSGLREYLAELSVSMPVTKLAKWKTTVQMVALGALTWTTGGAEIGLPAQEVGLVGLWIAAILTMITGYDYLRAGLAHIRKDNAGADGA